MKFRPDIEGLRALAIAPVVLFHAYPALLPGGFVGVDIFFVISGYLITSLLMQRLATRQYSIASFYAARIRRIFPALFFMLALTLPAAYCLMPPRGMQEFAHTMGASSLFVSNMELYRSTGYFDGAAELKPLLHTWSLAVEEQYYILFPPLLALLYRYRRAAITPLLAAIGVLSLLGSVWLLRHNPSLAFYAISSRAFELMIGSLLAVLPAAAAARGLRQGLALAGLAAVLAACLLYRPTTPFPGAAALLPCLGTALIIWSGGGPDATLVGRLLAAPPLRWLGALSFSLYLWHWPVLVFTRHALLGSPNAWQTAAAVLLAVLLAQASLRWVETPVRRASAHDRRLLLAGLACMLLSLLAAWALSSQAGRLQQEPGEAARLLAGAQDFSPERARCHRGEKDVTSYPQQCRFGAAAGPRHLAVWADSHGAELALALGERAATRATTVTQITSSSCPPAWGLEIASRPRCKAHNDAMLAALAADPTLDRVVLVARYGFYLGMDAPAFEAGLRHSVQTLLAAGKRVVLVDPYPGYDYPVPAALAARWRRGSDPAGFGQGLDDYRAHNAAALAMLERLAPTGASRLDTAGLLCGSGRCAVLAEGRPLYFDDNHLSMQGARLLAAALLP